MRKARKHKKDPCPICGKPKKTCSKVCGECWDLNKNGIRSKKAKKFWSKPGYKEKMSKIMDPYKRKVSPPIQCKCGCGEMANPGNKFIHGHNSRHNHPMKGKTLSDEMKERLREINTGKKSPMKGKKFSKEICKRMSDAHMGKPLSEKHCKSIGIASKKTWKNKTEKERKEWRRKIGEGNKGKIISKEVRLRHSKIMKQLWKDPEHAKKCLVFDSPNKCELKLLSILESIYPGEWKFVGDGQVVIDGKCPDFININGQKKIVELFGEFFHEKHEEDQRIKCFEPFGYETLVIWVKELSATKRLKQKIRNFCGGI